MAGKLNRRLSGRMEKAQSAWSSIGLTGRRLVDAVPLRYNNNNKNSKTRRPSSLGIGESIGTSTIAIAGIVKGGDS